MICHANILMTGLKQCCLKRLHLSQVEFEVFKANTIFSCNNTTKPEKEFLDTFTASFRVINVAIP